MDHSLIPCQAPVRKQGIVWFILKKSNENHCCGSHAALWSSYLWDVIMTGLFAQNPPPQGIPFQAFPTIVGLKSFTWSHFTIVFSTFQESFCNGWFKGNITGDRKPHISLKNRWFPVDVPLNLSIDFCKKLSFTTAVLFFAKERSL